MHLLHSSICYIPIECDEKVKTSFGGSIQKSGCLQLASSTES
jgi:hypothetical protein